MDEEIKQLILSTAAETRRQVEVMTEDMRRHVEVTAEETRRQVDSAAEEMRRHVDAVGEETRRHFGILAEDLRHQIQLTMEGVVANRGAIDQLREQMKEEFVELASMIRISYGQLDRRLRTLEEIVSGLLTRVDRLESASTQ